MTWRDDELTDDAGFDDAVDAVASEAEADAAMHEPPSFAAIVARAHRLDPSAIGAGKVEVARQIAITPRRGATGADDTRVLDPFIAELRARAEDDITARDEAGVPPFVRPRTGAIARMTVVFGALAAAAVVILGLDWAQSWRAAREQLAHDSSQSVSAVRDEPELYQAAPAEPATWDAPKSRPASTPAPSVAPTTLPSPTTSGITGTIPAPPSTPAPARSVAREAAPRVPADAPLRELDAQAQAARSAGDLDRADALYGEIIERGQRHPLVELAYGERFTLARRSGPSLQRKLWNAYLSTYPEGRFADDATAGLCRTAPVDDKAACWERYLGRFPSGTYATHAQRWLADGNADADPRDGSSAP
jgi:hypothetical protein